MPYSAIGGFPPQQLSYSKKNKVWRKRCVDFGDNHSLMNYHLTRKSVHAMCLNYDLLNGKLHIDDLKVILNPYDIDASFIPDGLQHYPIINSKLEVLRGEESKRLFDFKVVVTNPNAISEIEEEKNRMVNEKLQEMLMDTAQSEEEFQQELQKQSDYFQYEYQDKREVRGNTILNHYIKELEIDQLFNKGFEDAYTVGEEIYQCDIVGGEPIVEKLDPRKVRIVRSGMSSKIEDADMIILEDYWSPGKVIDTYWDQLSKKDIDAIENPNFNNGSYADSTAHIDSRYGIVPGFHYGWTAGDSYINPNDLFNEGVNNGLTPFDVNGNVRVLRVYWKSRRKIKKVKSYDPETGEEQFNFYPETYIIDPDKGEEEQVFWINEAWEGTKIGSDIYVNMRPRPIQYNRLSNPSRCHFGIIGSIYSNNGDKPFSLVDIMKPFSYLYDVTMDKLNKLLARNLGTIIKMDFAKTPKGWDPDKWMYYVKVLGIAAEDSFKAADEGPATGKIAGGLNNASSGVINASMGNEIQYHINMLEWLDSHAGRLAGITDQRLGQISNRETVGGVERSTLQSAHSTEWLFIPHESVKRRVLECFLETTKIAFKGRKKKFDYIMSDGSKKLIEIDGDEFAECDYGIVVDNSSGVQELNQKLDMLAQAGIQNSVLDFSTVMKLYTTRSMSEKQRIVEACEKRLQERREQEQQQQMQLQQQQMQQQAAIAQQQQQLQYQMHQEDNETKMLVAQINSQAEAQRFAILNHDNDEENAIKHEEMDEKAREFDAKLALDKEKHKDEMSVRREEIRVKNQAQKKNK